MTKRITRAALLTALALILFVAEAQIPPLVPIPGVKLGLANAVTVWAMFSLGPADTLAILLARILLGSVFAGSVSAAIFSLSGGVLCYLAMLLLRRILTESQMWVCSVFAAVCHNAGQLLAAILVYRTKGLALYFPVLMLSGIVTGLFTGLTAQLVARRLGRRG
ncbi:MAG: Gx transporter family protein [Oscillospiraceae bacterium]|nr:Gx transporter family protein [Oscillospiraceae bacterium]MBR4692229.1 Gx transporter family protein [Oscillospiraceae bacterium]